METMITDTTTLYLYVETPLHAGVGSGLSSIDLPIQRERTTQYPLIQGSGIKGKLRATAEEAQERNAFAREDIDILFGPSTISSGKNGSSASPSDHAGALIAGDARILLFPVRSLNGVFAYTTSYDVLNRFKRDMERGKPEQRPTWSIPEAEAGKALVTTSSEVQSNNTLVLEEFSFEAEPNKEVDTIANWIAEHALPELGGDYWANKVKNSLVILPNDDFRDFALYATEIITRVRITRDTKTVAGGALWTEEHLPTDTLLYVPMHATSARKQGATLSAAQVLEKIKELDTNYLQLGGDETVGRGLVRIRWGQ